MDVLHRWTLAMAAVLGLCSTAPVAAQGVFPGPETFPDLRLEVAGTVNSIVKYTDGGANVHYLIGGDFDLVNGVPRRNLARLDAAGVLDLNWSADTDGAVLTMALTGDQLFVGGTFSEVDGAPRVRLAKVDADDGVLAAWSPDANNTVNALQTDGTTVWAGGLFTVVEGQNRRVVAAIDAASGMVTAFNAAVTNGSVYALLHDSVANELYIGGQGRLKGSQRALLKVTASTGAALAWNPGIGPQGGSRVRALAMDGTTVYAVGRIRRAGGNNNRGNGARFLKSDASLQAWNPLADAEILAIGLDGTSAFVGGDFLNLAGHVRLAKTDATSGAALSWDADADRRVAALLVDGANLLAGGSFAAIEATGGQGGLTRLATANAAIDAGFAGDAAGPGFVTAFAFDAAGGVILGGSFDAARQDGEVMLYPRRNIVRLLPAGGPEAQYELDRVWTVDVAGEVHGVAIDGNDLFISGNFSQVGATARLRMAKLAADTGAVDATWVASADAPVRQLTVDGTASLLYAVGDFTTLGGAGRAFVGRVATTGTGAVDAWNPSPDDVVDTLLLSASGVYLGGSFANVNGGAAPRVGLARVDNTGTADPAFVANVDALGAVHALAEGADGIYVGGVFTTLGSATLNSLGRVALDGTVDAAWNPNVSGDVHSIGIDATAGFVYFGGLFANAGLQMHPNIARAAVAGGNVDPQWRPGTDGSVVQIDIPVSGEILIAGGFANVTGVMRNGIALLGDAVADLTTTTITAVTPTGGTAGTNSVFGQGYAVAWTVANASNPMGATPTGNVTVTASTGETCTAAAAVGTCTLAATATGARTLVAAFTGTALFVDSTSAPAAHTVDPAQVTLTVATSPMPSMPVDVVTATVTLNVVAPGAGTPQGQVVVTVDGAAGCTIDLSLGNSCSLGALAFGYHDIDATYTDSNAPVRHVAAPATTQHAVGSITTLALDIPGTATVGTPVVVTVNTTGIPNGEQVNVDGGLDCTITIMADTGTCNLTFDAAGNIPVTATYAGNDPVLPAQDDATVVVSRIATSIVLSALPANPAIGQPTTLTATTTGINDGAVLTVTNAPACPTITITGGTGNCPTSFASAGPVTVTADFAQTAERDAATDDLLIGVGKIATSFSLGLAPNNPVIGQSVTVSLVTPNLPANAVVTVTGGSGCTIDRSVSDSCSLSFAAAGVTPVNGQFVETATHFGSTASANATVGKLATSFGLGLVPAAPVVGQSVTVTLQSPVLPGNAVVTITGGSGCTINRAVSDSCSLSFAAAGAATVTGQFAETATHLASSATSNPTVAKANTSFTAFNADTLIGTPGASITFTWTVAATLPGQGTPTGNVRVSVNGDGTAPSCTVAVATGTCNIVFPAEGSFAMRADYLGDANFNASFSSSANVTIAAAAPTEADLQIAKIVSRSRLDPANQVEIVEFQIVVANEGPAAVTGAVITDVLPGSLSAAVWTCAPDDAGASCGAAGGNGSVNTTANLQAGTSVTITLQADVDNAPFPGVQNTATVAPPAGQNDPVMGNNSSTALYQACRANTGATLAAHFCTFKDGFEAPQP